MIPEMNPLQIEESKTVTPISAECRDTQCPAELALLGYFHLDAITSTSLLGVLQCKTELELEV